MQNLKQTYSLTSFIVNFRTQSNAIEKIKIKINWSLRCHIMPLINTKYKDIPTGETFNILTLEKHELFASKLSALLNRAKVRDLLWCEQFN